MIPKPQHAIKINNHPTTWLSAQKAPIPNTTNNKDTITSPTENKQPLDESGVAAT